MCHIDNEVGNVQNESITPPKNDKQSEKDKLSKKKVRKLQTEEEFQRQYNEFVTEGPTINTSDWYYDPEIQNHLDYSKKTDRGWILHAIEKAYYDKKYSKCMELIVKAESLFKIGETGDVSVVDKKAKKADKVDKQVLELLQLKNSCSKKIEQSRFQQK